MREIDRNQRISIVFIGLVQGYLLLLAHELITRKLWPASEPEWVIAWYSVVIAVPLSLQLGLSQNQGWRMTGFALATTVLFAGLGAYNGLTFAEGVDANYGSTDLSIIVLWFVGLHLAQVWLKSGKLHFPYPELFEHGWNNALTLMIAGFFTGIFWLVLQLCAELFNIINIHYFSDLFSDKFFIYPVTATVFGFAISLGLSRRTAIVALRGIVLTIFRGLLPVITIIELLFLCALPFTGVQLLWDTGHATSLMLILQITMILFINAVYQDGVGDPPYARWLRRIIQIALITLPVYSVLCVYALSLRVEQYGWSVDRVWAALLVLVAALYVSGYALAAMRGTSPWMRLMNLVNVGMALVVIIITVIVNTPLADPKNITVNSQLARLLEGRISPDKFDYDLLHFSLGKAGSEALLQLSKLQDHPQAEKINQLATASLAKKNQWESSAAQATTTTPELEKLFKVFPNNKKLEQDFLKFLLVDKQARADIFRSKPNNGLKKVLAIDLNDDSVDEYIVYGDFFRPIVYARRGEGWRNAASLSGSSSDAELEKLLEAGDYRIELPVWNNLRIGKTIYTLDVVPESDEIPTIKPAAN